MSKLNTSNKMKKLDRAKQLLKDLDNLRDNLLDAVSRGGEIEINWTNTGIEEITSTSSFFKEIGCNGAQEWNIIVHPYKSPYSK